MDAGVECVREEEKKKQHWLKPRSDMELYSAHHRATGSTGHRLHLHGAIVSTAFLPPQRSLLPHRWVDLARHAPNLAPLFWKAACFWLFNITYNGGCLKETVQSETGAHPHSNMWVLQWKHACRCAEGGFIDVVFVHLHIEGQVMLMVLCNDLELGCRLFLLPLVLFAEGGWRSGKRVL